MRVRYPRTVHLPWSPGATDDDVRAQHLADLAGREVVVTEKLDGENTTLYADGLHARSPDSAHHPSRAPIKALHARIAAHLPPGVRLCGENVVARHSIAYDRLVGWFYVFSAWEGDDCWAWDDTALLAADLGLPTVPVLWRGAFDEAAIRALRLDPARQEGYVVRDAGAFSRADFPTRVAKWVRPNHVTPGGTHWMLASVVPNGLGPTAPLWEVRSGGEVDGRALCAAVGLPEPGEDALRRMAVAGVEVDRHRPLGEARLQARLAALVDPAARPERARAAVMPAVLDAFGIPAVADLVGLREHLHRPIPDERRRGGLVSLARNVDLAALLAVARAALVGREDPVADEQIAWTELFAADEGLLVTRPFEELRRGVLAGLGGAPEVVVERVWAETLAALAEGRLRSPEEALARGHRWLAGDFPVAEVLVGPSGSGKSSFTAERRGARVVSLDALREEAGDRADQSRNTEILTEARRRWESALREGVRHLVWDATSLTRLQRDLPVGLARRHDALVRFVCVVAPEEALFARNRTRRHPVPEGVLATQLGKLAWPYAHEAHTVRWVSSR
ncbi:MAG: AAA family ATPase [Alphaproteobacteria bacterium]|nr:AAA family ATPase [Alphaproteobacteria bacterium]MCB9688293.1 AAA family ATPase [Alphaproteobacteria bacterium]MCB9697501.1 AAA family ATPase [Alphaproteobacteria bacterium]